jgi:hypothetical protein
VPITRRQPGGAQLHKQSAEASAFIGDELAVGLITEAEQISG